MSEKEVRQTLKQTVGVKEGSNYENRKEDAFTVSKYFESEGNLKVAERVYDCCEQLRFIKEPKQLKWKLFYANYCGVRNCPICMIRRTYRLQAKLFKIAKDFDDFKLIFLTLTIRNCQISELRETLKMMNSAWSRMRKKKIFQQICLGFMKTTEVTRSASGEAHPHFHIIIAVRKNYFSGRDYISQENWMKLWKESARLDYDPSVNVKKVREKKNSKDKALLEISKYTIKISQLIKSREWFLEYSKQTAKLRFFDVSGVFRELLKKLDATESSDRFLIENRILDGEIESLRFDWNFDFRGYISEPIKKGK